MSNSVNAHGASTEASPLSRAPADQGAGRGREQGEDLSSGHPIHPPSSTSTREPATMDGWPTTATAKAMLRQLDADRERSGYWRSRWAEDHSDHAIETWLRSLLDWLETAQPVDGPPSAGPLEAHLGARSIEDIQADLELAKFVVVAGRFEATDAWHRLARDVPQLLAEVEAAHRFEQSAALDSARLAAVEDLIGQARKVSPSDSMTVYVGDLKKALARRADNVRGIRGAES